MKVETADWEVKQVAIQIYAHMVSNPRKSTANMALARDAIIAAIDFQIEWNQHSKLKAQELAAAAR